MRERAPRALRLRGVRSNVHSSQTNTAISLRIPEPHSSWANGRPRGGLMNERAVVAAPGSLPCPFDWPFGRVWLSPFSLGFPISPAVPGHLPRAAAGLADRPANSACEMLAQHVAPRGRCQTHDSQSLATARNGLCLHLTGPIVTDSVLVRYVRGPP